MYFEWRHKLYTHHGFIRTDLLVYNAVAVANFSIRLSFCFKEPICLVSVCVFFFSFLLDCTHKHNIFALLYNSCRKNAIRICRARIFTRELRQCVSSHSFMHKISTLCICDVHYCKQHSDFRRLMCHIYVRFHVAFPPKKENTYALFSLFNFSKFWISRIDRC